MNFFFSFVSLLLGIGRPLTVPSICFCSVPFYSNYCRQTVVYHQLISAASRLRSPSFALGLHYAGHNGLFVRLHFSTHQTYPAQFHYSNAITHITSSTSVGFLKVSDLSSFFVLLVTTESVIKFRL